METSSDSVSELLKRWNDGDKDALDQLMPKVYSELRRMAAAYGAAAVGPHPPDDRADTRGLSTAGKTGRKTVGKSRPLLRRRGLNRGVEAAVEFKKILDNRGQAPLSPLYPLAYLGLARSWNVAGETSKSIEAQNDFLAAWKDADPDLPILIQAKREFASR